MLAFPCTSFFCCHPSFGSASIMIYYSIRGTPPVRCGRCHACLLHVLGNLRTRRANPDLPSDPRYQQLLVLLLVYTTNNHIFAVTLVIIVWSVYVIIYIPNIYRRLLYYAVLSEVYFVVLLLLLSHVKPIGPPTRIDCRSRSCSYEKNKSRTPTTTTIITTAVMLYYMDYSSK